MSARNPKRGGLGNILVATDFSAGAAHAVARAAMLPLRPTATLTILHIVPQWRAEQDRQFARTYGRALTETAALAVEAAEKAGIAPPTVKTALARGDALLEIIHRARAVKAELIVVGRHGEGRPFRDLFVGSSAERVMRKGDRSVLLVNRTATAPYRRPLVAIDFSETCKRAAELAFTIAGQGEHRIESLHVEKVPVEIEGVRYHKALLERALRAPPEGRGGAGTRKGPAEGVRAQLEAFVASLPPPAGCWRPVVRHGDPRRVIVHRAKERECDLIALGTRGRTGLAYVLVGSVAVEVVRRAHCDVLVARRPSEGAFELP